MTNVTFSVDEEIHKKMKFHPEIKWTEILRRAILDYLIKIEETNVISMKELRNQLDEETLSMIESLNENDEITFYEEIKKMEKDRIKKIYDLDQSEEK
jgi:hypothetical protein